MFYLSCILLFQWWIGLVSLNNLLKCADLRWALKTILTISFSFKPSFFLSYCSSFRRFRESESRHFDFFPQRRIVIFILDVNYGIQVTVNRWQVWMTEKPDVTQILLCHGRTSDFILSETLSWPPPRRLNLRSSFSELTLLFVLAYIFNCICSFNFVTELVEVTPVVSLFFDFCHLT